MKIHKLKNYSERKTNKVTICLDDTDYVKLLKMSELKKSNASNYLRTLINNDYRANETR